jgi:hypothetical protein
MCPDPELLHDMWIKFINISTIKITISPNTLTKLFPAVIKRYSIAFHCIVTYVITLFTVIPSMGNTVKYNLKVIPRKRECENHRFFNISCIFCTYSQCHKIDKVKAINVSGS